MVGRTTRTPAWLGLALVCLGAVSVHAQQAPEKAAICTGCHGENGVPADAATPVINGQQEGYLYLELRDYKLGNRKNELMQQIATDLSKPDMQELAAWFSQRPSPNLGQSQASDDVARHVQTINGSAGCSGCHGQDWLGNSAIPRVADQSYAYLRGTMLAFKTGARGNNPWMSALLKTYSDSDIGAMAKYLAGL